FIELHSLWMWFLVGLILIYAKWWAWYGGWFWGPRFFLIASVPASFALALWLHQRDQPLLTNLITLTVLLVTCWVGLNGAIFSQHDLGPVCQAGSYRYESLCFYTFDFGALTHPFVLFYLFGFSKTFVSREQLTTGSFLYAGYTLVVFVYLAAPLAVRALRQLTTEARALLAIYARPGVWRL
ncbi:MAG TPA: hypothetical protein VKQ36_13475, partial [Ktedonobacterales bacterium]|nr:hypothetical protein [Ktedonobacterales bacterium]